MTAEEYRVLADRKTPKNPFFRDCAYAFLVGGGICMLGEGIWALYLHFGVAEQSVGTLESVTLIGLSVLATGLGVYDRLAAIGGAGTLVPITGFANATASPTLEYRAEGAVLGIGPKAFSVAGAVIAYGTSVSAVYGVIYYLLQRIGEFA